MKLRMVDRILHWQSRRLIRGVKAVSFEEYELRRPLGDEPCLPESLIVESLFQLGNWLVMLSTDFGKMGIIVRFEDVRFIDRLRPGRRLDLEAHVRSWRDDGIVFDGQASAGDQAIVAGRGCLATPVPLADYYAPEDLRVLFSEIYRQRRGDPRVAQLVEDAELL